ncbi:hypothetical protein BDA99DRAFT_512055 [Phascolomyces articulosus]|uniref:Uncharacterized protein n=1 Tax=Phascolomyces articulosus TaxID=60185 RepID=A0AAD5K8W6_9FUNG|nr:hypothetical protein BDA99DRAFT_512055 [Phascolomyces articulosus]
MNNQRTALTSTRKKYLQTKLSFAPVNTKNNNNNDENKRPTATLSSQYSSSPSSSNASNTKKFKTLNDHLKESLVENNKGTITKSKPASLKRTITPTEEISRLSFTTPTKQQQPQQSQQPTIIEPPTLHPIKLLYSEEELWIRLQIREFVFRFGEHFEIDARATTSLQNVQGNWRVKRLAVNLTWQLLTSMEQGLIDIPSSSFEPPTNKYSLFYGARTTQQFAQRILFQWMDHYGLNNNRYLEKEAARVAFVENLEHDGLSVHHWEDLIELFSIITGVPSASLLAEEQGDEESATINNNENNVVLPESERVVHSSLEELRMLQMMCDMLLMHNTLRRIWLHEEQPKELKATETELKFERKRLESSSQEEDKHVKAERLQVEKKMVDVLTAQQKNMKRFTPAGHDTKGNEYWIFNDLVTYGNDARNSELYWGHGVIIIGPGFDTSDNNDMPSSLQNEEGQQQNWWYVTDVNDLIQLRRYILQDRSSSSSLSPSSSPSSSSSTMNTDTLSQQMTLRIHYMSALQYIIAQGNTSNSNNYRRSTRA